MEGPPDPDRGPATRGRVDERVRKLIEHGNDVITLLDAAGCVLYSTQSLKPTLGYAAGEMTGRSALDLVHPDERPDAERLLRDVVETPGQVRRTDLRLCHKNGSWRDLEVVVVNRLDDPDIGAVVVTYHDVTERNRAERALRESDERFRQMAEHVKEALFLVSLPSGAPLYVSPTWTEIWGRPMSEAGDPRIWLDSVHADDRAQVAAGQQRVADGEATTSTFRVVRPDGALRWVRGRAFPVRDATGRVYRLVGVAEDVTELRRTEEQAIRAQRMEAVGRLAGGVAHDFNNLLTVIQAEVDLLSPHLTPGHPGWEAVHQIRKATHKAASLTRQLLAFSRRQLIEPTVFPLNGAVSDMATMLRRLIGEDVHLHVSLAPDAGAVKADRGQIEQVVTNLAVNARDAMPHGGSLSIETGSVLLDDEVASEPYGLAPGRYVLLAVSDTGTGMSDEVKARALEPFFTTKDPGKGTGLGLPTCYGIVKASGGHLAIESEPGIGTTVRVYLPESHERVSSSRPLPSAPPPSSGETVLVVEDDAAVRRATVRMLGLLGYRVLGAQDAADALALIKSTDERIHLLLTDVVLPGMGGRELADAIKRMRPQTKVLFASGYSDDVVLQDRLLEQQVALLEKPFTRDSLASAVRAALDR